MKITNPPIARLIDGPRGGDRVEMTWHPKDHPIFRGDTIRVLFKQKPLEPMGVARYAFEMVANNGDLVHRFVDIEPSLI